MNKSRMASCIGAVVGFVLSACPGTKGGAGESARSAGDVVEVASVEAALVMLTVGEGEDAQAVAAQAALQVESTFDGCVTTTTEGRTTTWTFAGCSGPFGLVSVQGQLVATYALTSGGIHAVVHGEQLMANALELDFEADVLYQVEDGVQVLDVQSASEGVGPRGYSVSRRGDYRLDWDGACLGLDGDWTGVRVNAWSLNVAGYRRCGAECPAAGGRVTREGAGTLVIGFDGDTTADWQTDNSSGEIQLFCGE